MDNYILITGATSGFGKACAELYAKNSWNLILTGRRKERLISIASDLRFKFKVEVIILNFDIRNEKEVIDALLTIPEGVQNKVEILINNAGLAVGRGSIENGVTDDWERMIDTNVKGLLYVSCNSAVDFFRFLVGIL